MAECWNTDTGEAVYRSTDAVKNLRIKVRIERVTSSVTPSKHLQQQILPQHERGAIELQTLTSQDHTGDTVEEVVVSWQEKLFSQYEMELFQNEAACQTPLDRQYHTEVKALIKLKHQQNHRIFTYTDHDRYTDCLTFHQLQSTDLLTTARSAPTFLAEKMASMRHRRHERRTTDSSIPSSKIINWEPTKDFVRNSHTVNNALQTMYIMGDLSLPGQLGQKENECLLLTIKTDGNGTIFVKPDFNKGKEPYRGVKLIPERAKRVQDFFATAQVTRIVTEGEKREVWRLTVENVSIEIKPEDKDREQNMYKDLYLRHKEYLNSVVGQDFEMPPVGVLRYLMYGEIVSAKGFEYDNLYIQFFVELPSDWLSLPFQVLSGVTQTCQTKTLGKDGVAFFSYPFSCEAFCRNEKEREECSPHWPVLYFKVLSLDSWQRYRTEGYGYVVFPSVPGEHTMTCHTWRPLHTGTRSALRRFFIGGSPELEDHSYIRIPGTFQGERLSRFGFSTETTGSVTFTLHCIQQARSFVDAGMLKKRRQKVLDQLGGFSQQEALHNILEVFQRSRSKVLAARESLPRDLINTTSQLQSESAAQDCQL